MFIIKTSIKNIENKAGAMTFVMDDKVGSINDFLARGLLTILSIGGEQRWKIGATKKGPTTYP
jgi:hypothetical protein